MLETNVGNLFDKAIKYYSDLTALRDQGVSFTYKELGEKVNRFANALLGLGVKKGDSVALWTNNCIEYVVTDFAILKIGAVRVPFNHFLSDPEVAYRLEDSNAKALICGAEFFDRAQKIIKELGSTAIVVPIGTEGENSFNGLIAKASANPPQSLVSHEDLAAIMYTGGTTGKSKGVMHTHKSLISIMYSELVEFELERGVVMLHIAPLQHAAGFMVLPGLLRGGTQIIQDGFDPTKFCEVVQQEKVTFTFLVPTMIYKLLDMADIERYDFHSLKTLVYGASPMAPARIKQALKLWGPILAQGYSLMEVANQTSYLTKEDHMVGINGDEKRLLSCGRPVTMANVKILDLEGNEVAPGVVGEIVTRGPHLMKGYWKKEKETSEAVKSGWLHTGDLAYQDEAGYLYIVDRSKDMIVTGGMNVYSTSVEAVLFEHPSVLEAVVIGVPDKKWGETVKAIVVCDQQRKISEDELLNFCKEKLAKYEVPKSVEFVKKCL